MAIYHLSAKIITRGKGATATAAAAYRAAAKIHDERTGLTHDYQRRRGVYGTEILAPDGAPAWTQQRAWLWNAVEKAEKRRDAQVAREFDVALPKELTHRQKQELLRSFVKQHFVSQGMIADIAYHDFASHNPHAHVMLTMRPLEGEGFGKKERAWNDTKLLQQWREAWAEHANHALERAGQAARIDHRSLKEQGIERLPQIHLGKTIWQMQQRGIDTARGAEYNEISTLNSDLARVNRMIAEEIERMERRKANEQNNRPPARQASAASKPDLTQRALRRQLDGMNASLYEIGIYERKTSVDPDTGEIKTSGRMMQRTWSRDQLEKNAAFLKRMNAQGNDIYIRPAGSQGLVLVDDLDLAKLKRLEQDGLKPAAVVQTSPMNYQAWIRLSDQPMTEQEATAAAKILAARYGGDPGSADWRHYGRLAGFTNQKPHHRQENGKAPFVLAHSGNGNIALNARQLRLEAQEALQVFQHHQKANTPASGQETGREGHPSTLSDKDQQRAADTFARFYLANSQRSQHQDESLLDWVTCKQMAKKGFSDPAIRHALRHTSPDLETRKAGHVEDYVRRTVDKVMAEPEVTAARSQHRKEKPSPSQHQAIAQHHNQERER
jgi:hypothetical protein